MLQGFVAKTTSSGHQAQCAEHRKMNVICQSGAMAPCLSVQMMGMWRTGSLARMIASAIKRCNSHDEQCKKFFGKEAKTAHQICYKGINTQCDCFGHCGMEDTCGISDVLRGQVLFEIVTQIPSLKDHNTVH